MTGNTGILSLRLAPLSFRELTILRLMASEAALAIVLKPLCRLRNRMCVMAGQATHSSVTVEITFAVAHLFDLAHGLSETLITDSVTCDKDELHLFQPHSRPKIEHSPTVTSQRKFPLEVAVIANILAPSSLQFGRIDDGIRF